MKNILFLLSFIISSVYAQPNSKYELLSNSKRILLPEGIGKESKENPINGRVYNLIQFYEIPKQNEKMEMMNLGLRFLEYIPNYAYVVSLPANVNFNSLEKYKIRSIAPIAADIKVNKNLFLKNFPEHAIKEKGKVDVVIKYHFDLPHEMVKSVLQKKSVTIVSENKNAHTVTIRVLQNKVLEISAIPVISYMEFPAPPSTPDDTKGRTLHRSNVINSDYPMGRHYDGTGVTVGLADDGMIGPHIDYTGRLTQYAPTDFGTHGDMTAGILFGCGNRDSKIAGMASGAYMHYWDIGSYTHIVDAVDHMNNLGVVITSTSYSQGCNQYTTDSETADRQINQNRPLIHIFSAGNNSQSDCGYGAGTGWGTITGGYKSAKNVIATGNVGATDALDSYSSWGPASDGRVKPDICANGLGQLSTDSPNTTQTGGGTSAAAPGLAGITAQLYHAYKSLNSGNNPESGLIKAAMLNTAEDIGNVGPDFKFGWGRVNAYRAVRVLEENRYIIDSITQGTTNSHIINVPAGVTKIKAMVYWPDVEGSPAAGKALVNDINIQLVDPSSNVYNPWRLDPTPDATKLSSPAFRGVDSLNNAEQVTLDNPVAGVYTLTVEGFQIPQGPQRYFVIYEFVDDNVSLTYPIGGEPFAPSSSDYIRWDANGNSGTFKLEYSIDGGNAWTTINSSISATTRFYNWNPPSVTTGKARIKITRGASSDSSKVDFSIIPVPTSFSVKWVCPDSIQLVWKPVPTATSYQIHQLGSMYMDSIGTTTDTFFVVRNIPSTDSGWFSVKCLGADNAVGRRAIAIEKPIGTTNCSLPEDLVMQSIISPTNKMLNNCQPISPVPVIIKIKNQGQNPISNFPLTYLINGALGQTENFTGTLLAGEDTTFEFSQTIDASIAGNYLISAKIAYASDMDATNDSVAVYFETVSGTTAAYPWSESFESFTTCTSSSTCELITCNLTNGMVNETNTLLDDIDWRIFKGSTPTASTGPDVDHTLGDANGKYAYLEASSCFLQYANLNTPCIDLTSATAPQLNYWYHLSGTSMGQIFVDVYADGVWTSNVSFVSGNKGNAWLNKTASLSAYVGKKINIRFRGRTGNGAESDMAIDDLYVGETVSINENNFNGNVAIYPNPSTGLFNYEINNLSNSPLTILVNDISGKLIYSENSGASQYQSGQIDLSKFENGIYFIEIKSNNNSYRTRIAKM